MEEDSSGGPNRDDQTNVSILSYLSFTVPIESQGEFFRPMSARHRHRHQASATMQGVLWKRRDVFRNRWRPRWFVLHPQQGILTYYLLSGTPQNPTAVSAGELGSNRRRADSDISMDTVDYDVVPRGSIFLGNPSCTVEANESLTRVEERLYALTISDRETGTHCHLACRSSTARDRWLEKIQEAIIEHQSLTASQRDGDQEVTEPAREDGISRAVPSLPAELSRSEYPSNQKDSSPSSLSSEKWVTVPSSNLTKGVPPSVVAKIDSLLEANLPYAMEANHPDFKVLYETEGVKLAKHKSLPLLRSSYSTKHHPADYLGLLWDFPMAAEIEPNLRIQESTRNVNEHTSFVYTVYQPVWPSAPRDFSSVSHWRLLENSQGDSALCLLSFSCPEANKLKPPQEGHVRGTLNVSMHIWKPTQGGGCAHTRILSFDLNGNMPKPLVQTVHQQQVTLPPRAMDLYLQANKTTAKETEHATNLYQMDYNTMYRALDRVKSRRKPVLRHDDSMVVCSGNPREQNSFKVGNDVSILVESTVLVIPLILQRLLVSISPRLELIICVTGMVLCVRWVLLQHLLRFYRLQPLHKGLTSIDSLDERTICRVGLDIRTLLDFLENEKQARIALGEEDLAALNVNHVLLRAVAKAMQRCPMLLVRSFPLLPPLYNMDMEWHDPQHRLPVWIPSSELWSIQTIADFCIANQGQPIPPMWSLPRVLGPSCRIFTSSYETSSHSNHTIFSTSPTKLDCPISIMVFPYGGLNTSTPPDTSVPDKGYPGSHLELSITLQTTDMAVCHEFVEELEKFIQYPELCDA